MAIGTEKRTDIYFKTAGEYARQEARFGAWNGRPADKALIWLPATSDATAKSSRQSVKSTGV